MEVRFFQGTGPVADMEIEIHARLCGGSLVVPAQELEQWSKRLRRVAGIHTFYTLRGLRMLPPLLLVGTLTHKQLDALYLRALREKRECTVVDVRR